MRSVPEQSGHILVVAACCSDQVRHPARSHSIRLVISAISKPTSWYSISVIYAWLRRFSGALISDCNASMFFRVWAVRGPHLRNNEERWATCADRFRSSTILRANYRRAFRMRSLVYPFVYRCSALKSLRYFVIRRSRPTECWCCAATNAPRICSLAREARPRPTFIDSALTPRGSCIFMSCPIYCICHWSVTGLIL